MKKEYEIESTIIISTSLLISMMFIGLSFLSERATDRAFLVVLGILWGMGYLLQSRRRK